METCYGDMLLACDVINVDDRGLPVGGILPRGVFPFNCSFTSEEFQAV